MVVRNECYGFVYKMYVLPRVFYVIDQVACSKKRKIRLLVMNRNDIKVF